MLNPICICDISFRLVGLVVTHIFEKCVKFTRAWSLDQSCMKFPEYDDHANLYIWHKIHVSRPCILPDIRKNTLCSLEREVLISHAWNFQSMTNVLLCTCDINFESLGLVVHQIYAKTKKHVELTGAWRSARSCIKFANFNGEGKTYLWHEFQVCGPCRSEEEDENVKSRYDHWSV